MRRQPRHAVAHAPRARLRSTNVIDARRVEGARSLCTVGTRAARTCVCRFVRAAQAAVGVAGLRERRANWLAHRVPKERRLRRASAAARIPTLALLGVDYDDLRRIRRHHAAKVRHAVHTTT
eukprot:1257783-Prymnesium_polylepis.2